MTSGMCIHVLRTGEARNPMLVTCKACLSCLARRTRP